MSDPTALTVAESAARLAGGALGAVELTEAYLARIAAVDGVLNAYVAILADPARAEARAAEARQDGRARLGPLDGIPVALKDNIDVAGVPTTNGMGSRPGAVAGRDAEVVRRLRAAGAVVLGKLNMHEGALGATTDNPHHGRTHNPWKLGYTPGGSSGGSAAAVAARLCAAALGTDTMGSVRLPAAYCGVAGLKPTYGLVSTRGVVPLSWRLDHVGPLARGVGDLALVLDALAGFVGESMEARRAPADVGDRARPAAGQAGAALDGLVVGRLTNLEETDLDPDVRRALEAGAGLLRDLGAVLRPVTLPGYEPSSARRAGLLVCEAEGAVVHERDLAAHPGAFSPEFRRMLEFGRDAPAARLVKAGRVVESAGFALRRALEQVDLIVAPATAQPAFAFEVPAPVTQADMTALASFAGCPAVTVPCDLSAAGLPLGLQLIGRPFAERALLRAAGLVEAACRFAERFPPPPLR